MPVKIAALTTVRPENTEELSIYMATTSPLLQQAGAKILARFPIAETVVGQTEPTMLTIVEYPNHDAVSLVFDSSEYGLLSEVRQKAFSTYEIFMLEETEVEGDTALAS